MPRTAEAVIAALTEAYPDLPPALQAAARHIIDHPREVGVESMRALAMKKMHQRGIRVLIGGDYGFAWTPHGTNAKDFEYFVDMLGMSPMEAIQAGTKYGGEIMGMGNELGMIKEGYLADLLLVDGDPSVDVRVLQDKSRLVAIMKDGKFHKTPDMHAGEMRMTAYGR